MPTRTVDANPAYPARPGTELKSRLHRGRSFLSICSWSEIVWVETMSCRPQSVAWMMPGTRYASDLPIPVPASKSSGSSSRKAAATACAIRSWPGRCSRSRSACSQPPSRRRPSRRAPAPGWGTPMAGLNRRGCRSWRGSSKRMDPAPPGANELPGALVTRQAPWGCGCGPAAGPARRRSQGAPRATMGGRASVLNLQRLRCLASWSHDEAHHRRAGRLGRRARPLHRGAAGRRSRESGSRRAQGRGRYNGAGNRGRPRGAACRDRSPRWRRGCPPPTWAAPRGATS